MIVYGNNLRKSNLMHWTSEAILYATAWLTVIARRYLYQMWQPNMEYEHHVNENTFINTDKLFDIMY